MTHCSTLQYTATSSTHCNTLQQTCVGLLMHVQVGLGLPTTVENPIFLRQHHLKEPCTFSSDSKSVQRALITLKRYQIPSKKRYIPWKKTQIPSTSCIFFLSWVVETQPAQKRERKIKRARKQLKQIGEFVR